MEIYFDKNIIITSQKVKKINSHTKKREKYFIVCVIKFDFLQSTFLHIKKLSV